MKTNFKNKLLFSFLLGQILSSAAHAGLGGFFHSGPPKQALPAHCAV